MSWFRTHRRRPSLGLLLCLLVVGRTITAPFVHDCTLAQSHSPAPGNGEHARHGAETQGPDAPAQGECECSPLHCGAPAMATPELVVLAVAVRVVTPDAPAPAPVILALRTAYLLPFSTPPPA